MMKRRPLVGLTTLATIAVGVVALVAWSAREATPAAVTRPPVVATFPHDAQAYCQGLVFHDGVLYEGTGKYGQSSLRKVALESGQILQRHQLSEQYFGEGIAILGGKIYQLTWRERVALVYDLKTLRPTGEVFRYTGEGWGLTTDGQHLIMSDGTSVLRFLDPRTFRVVRRVTVQEGRRRILNLNELEYVDGEIYANIWQEDFIARISPQTGRVLGWIDLRGLLPSHLRTADDHVLNGIAYDAGQDRLFVTGKNWPRLYELRR